MANYYFLAASLPPLVLGEKPELTYEELNARLEINLTKEDFEKVVVFRRFTDINNIRALLLEEPIEPQGNLQEKELDEALLIHNILPVYVFDFLDQYETLTEKIRFFFGLISRYFTEEIPKQKGFLKRYLSFEREWRLVMLGLRSKELGRDITRELQFEDFADPLVADILAQRDAAHYEPPIEYKELKDKLASCGPDPWEKYKVFARYKFNKIEELVDRPLFHIDWILAYMAQLALVQHWFELDEMRGKMILETFKSA